MPRQMSEKREYKVVVSLGFDTAETEPTHDLNSAKSAYEAAKDAGLQCWLIRVKTTTETVEHAS